MRIAVNARVVFDDKLEGVGRYIYETTYRMIKNNPDHEFVILYDRKYQDLFGEFPNVTKKVVYPQARHPLLWNIWFEVMLPRLFKKENIDVFYSGDTYLSLHTDVPTLLVSHDIAYKHYPDHIPARVLKYYETNFPAFHHKAKHIISVSEATKKDIVETYDLDPAKVTVAHNALPQGFEPLSDEAKTKIRAKISDGNPYFLYLGSLHPRKNIVGLVKAFELFKEKNKSQYKLVLVGRMAWKTKEIEKALTKSKFKNDIIHLENITDGVYDIMAAADAFLYLSFFEGFGIPILEAMACKVPVICSNVSSMPEVANESALLVDPTNIKEIAVQMQAIITNENLRKRLIEKGLENVKTFDWDKTSATIWENLVAINKNKNE
jgi:glycosyltransferase involved in cell wall biosynthesis